MVTPNKPNSRITSPTVNGLRVDETGKVVGTPAISNWGDEEEERNVTISVTVTHENDQPVTKDVVVKVLRDTDGDGTPDKTDNDDDGDGIDDNQDSTPKPTPEVPTDNTERKPETEKPTVPDTKQAEQPTQTVDAQVAPSQNQAVLPNTGTKADRATGALGALSLLGAFGLLFAKKKKDDEEETRNN